MSIKLNASQKKLKNLAQRLFLHPLKKSVKTRIKQFVSTVLIYSQLFHIAAYAAMPMYQQPASQTPQWGNQFKPINTNVLPPTTPMQQLNLTSQQFGLNGPLTWGVNYSDLTGTFVNGQYLFSVNERLALAALGEYGSGQYRFGGTAGFAFLPLSQMKFTAERFSQRLPFYFSTGSIDERVHQDAYGARFQQLFSHPFLQAINGGGYYADAGNKYLDPISFTANGTNCGGAIVGSECIDYRHLAGAISKGIDAGVEFLLTPSTLVGGNVYYDRVHYKTRFDTLHENRDGIGGAIKFNHLFNNRFKLLGEASVRKIYDTYQGGVSWVPPTKTMGLELALTGQHLVSHNSTPDNNSVSLQINWVPGHAGYEDHFNWHTKQLSNIAQWVQTPAVHMGQVLAVAEQYTQLLAPIISTIMVNNAFAAESKTVTITGANFVPGTQVLFGEQPASSINVHSASLIMAKVPPASGVEVVDVVVKNPDGKEARRTAGYTYPTIKPLITKIQQNEGTSKGGVSVVITGKNLSDLTKVTFGGTKAQIVKHTATEITATTPAHDPGIVDVAIVTKKGEAIAEHAFTYTDESAVTNPVITQISPAAGPTAGGAVVTISGANFGNQPIVTFAGSAAAVLSKTPNIIVVNTPSHAAGVVSVIVTSGGMVSTPVNYTYEDGNSQGPVVTMITPASGPTAGGTTVTIMGSGFDSPASVVFGDLAANIVSQTSTQLIVLTPAHGAGSLDVLVTTEKGTMSAPVKYTYGDNSQDGPAITAIAPTSGPTTGGSVITIMGTHFDSPASVNFDGVVGKVVSQTANRLIVVTPAHAVGPTDVTLSTSQGSTIFASGYTYIAAKTLFAPPTITNLSATSGPVSGGQTITITGSGFIDGATTVTFSGVMGTSIVVMSPSQLSVITPAGTGTVNVVVSTPDGSSNNAVYTYVPPTISTINPLSGPTAGGQVVTINGSDFGPGATVSFGGSSASPISITPNQIVVTSPAAGSGQVDVRVNISGSLSNPASYTYGPPTIVGSINPAFGPTSGGQTVSLTGINFVANDTTVTFNGTPGTGVNVIDSSHLTVVTPAGSAGVANVVATTTAGSSGANTTYTYVAAPTIGTLNPSSGPIGGGQTVTISGSNFVTGQTTVTFDGTPGTGVTLNGTSQLTVTTPAHAAGTVNVQITTPGGTSGTRPYIYRDAPGIIGLSSTSGPAGGGQVITITGSDFVAGSTAVFFDANPGINVIVNSPSQLIVTTPQGVNTVTVTAVTTGGTSNGVSYTYNPPTLGGISPTFGPISGGQTVTLTGSNFVVGNTTVTFGGSTGTGVNVLSPTSLTVTSPAHTAGLVNVVVTTGVVTSNPVPYTYQEVTISTINPSAGPSGGGQVVTITGSGFTPSATVHFGSNPATNVTYQDPSHLIVTTPPGSGVAAVAVTTALGTSNNYPYTYNPPTIGGISPAVGPTSGGQTVTITGSNFVAGTTSVTFDGNPGTSVTVNSPSQLTVVTPPGSAGVVPVVVTAGDASSGSGSYTYQMVTIATLSPTSGPETGGQVVTITGTNFSPGSTVTFGGIPGTNVTVLGLNQLIVTTPAGTGLVPVIVTAALGTSNPVSYLYQPAPIISTLNPSSGPERGGQTITINGANFTSGTSVSFGGTPPSSVTVLSSSRLVVTTPPGSGVVNVSVTTEGGASNVLPYTYIAAPTISSVTPSSGSENGGQTVTIVGSNFVTGATTVSFGGRAGTNVQVVSPSTLLVIVPAGNAGPVDVVVTTVGGSAVAANGYTYTGEAPASTQKKDNSMTYAYIGAGVAAAVGGSLLLFKGIPMPAQLPAGVQVPSVVITPTSGEVTGGKKVTIKGDFERVKSVRFGGQPAKIINASNAGRVTVITPAHEAGPVNISINTNKGTVIAQKDLLM